MSKQLVPNYGQAILKPIEEGEQFQGNIIIPDIENTRASQAEIIKLAPIYNYNTGTIVPCMFNEGDIVVFPSMGAQKVTLDRVDYFVASISDLLAAIK